MIDLDRLQRLAESGAMLDVDSVLSLIALIRSQAEVIKAADAIQSRMTNYGYASRTLYNAYDAARSRCPQSTRKVEP